MTDRILLHRLRHNNNARNAEARSIPRQFPVVAPEAAQGLPDRSRIHYNRGLLLVQMGRDADAEEALRTALRIEPERIDYLYALIDFCARRGRLEEALELARRMVEAHPGNRMGYDLRDAIADRINSLDR